MWKGLRVKETPVAAALGGEAYINLAMLRRSGGAIETPVSRAARASSTARR